MSGIAYAPDDLGCSERHGLIQEIEAKALAQTSVSVTVFWLDSNTMPTCRSLLAKPHTNRREP